MKIEPETVCTDIALALGTNLGGLKVDSTIDPENFTPLQQDQVLGFTLIDGVNTCDAAVTTMLSAYTGLAGALSLALIGAFMIASRMPVLLLASNVIQWPTLLAYLTPVFVIGKVFNVFDVRENLPVLLTILFLTYPILTISRRSLEHASSSYDAQCQGRGFRLRFMVLVAFPAALPQILIAARLAVPWAILGAMLGEWIGAQPGLGYTIAGAVTQVRMTHLGVYALLAGAGAVIPMFLIQVAIHLVYRQFRLDKRDIAFEPTHIRSEPIGWGTIFGTLMIVVAVWVLAHHATPQYVPSIGEMIEAGTFGKTDWKVFIAALATLTVTGMTLMLGILLGFLLALISYRRPLIRALSSLSLLPLQILPLLIFVPLLNHLDIRVSAMITVPTQLNPGLFDYVTALKGQIAPFAVGLLACAYVAYQIGQARLQALPDGIKSVIPPSSNWRWPPFRDVYIPWIWKSAFLAIEVGLPRIFLGVVVTEALVSGQGLGHLLDASYADNKFDVAWLVVLLTCTLSIAMFVLAQKLYKASNIEEWTPVVRSQVPADDIRHTSPSLASSTLTTLAAAVLGIWTLDSEVWNTPFLFVISTKGALLGFSIAVLIVLSVSAYYIEQSAALVLADYYLPKIEWFMRFIVYTTLFLVFYFLATNLEMFFYFFVLFIGAMWFWSWYLTSFGPLNFFYSILKSNRDMFILSLLFSFFASELVFLAEQYNQAAAIIGSGKAADDFLSSLRETNTRKVQESLRGAAILLGLLVAAIVVYIVRFKKMRANLQSLRATVG